MGYSFTLTNDKGLTISSLNNYLKKQGWLKEGIKSKFNRCYYTIKKDGSIIELSFNGDNKVKELLILFSFNNPKDTINKTLVICKELKDKYGFRVIDDQSGKEIKEFVKKPFSWTKSLGFFKRIDWDSIIKKLKK